MFNGSENYNDDYFKAVRAASARPTSTARPTPTARTTSRTCRRTALDLALWMESDRMGHLLGAIDQARLDEQRGVVQNEKRQGENQPYGSVSDELIAKRPIRPGHPYSWTPIGSMDDLDAATLDDVQGRGSAPTTAPPTPCSCVAGDIDARRRATKVAEILRRHPARARRSRVREPWIAKRTGDAARGAAGPRPAGAPLQGLERAARTARATATASTWRRRCSAAGKTSRLYRAARPRGADRDRGRGVCVAAGDRRALRRRGDGDSRARISPRSSGRSTRSSRRSRRGRPHTRGAEAREGGAARQLPARHRAGRRLRRQVGRARRERGPGREPGCVQAQPRAPPGRDPERGSRCGAALARRGLDRDRGAPGSRAACEWERRRSQQASRRGRAARSAVSGARAHALCEWARADRGRAPRRAARALRAARRRRLCGGSRRERGLAKLALALLPEGTQDRNGLEIAEQLALLGAELRRARISISRSSSSPRCARTSTPRSRSSPT